MKKIIVLMAAVSILSLSCNGQAKPAEGAVSEDASYAFGMAIAYNFKDIAIELDYNAFLNGMKDVLDKDEPKFSMEEAEAIIQTAITEAMTKQAEVAIAKEQEFFAENGKKAGIVTTASGLQYEVLKAGTGPKPTATDVVTVHYTGSFLNGDVFDSSIERGEPIELHLHAVIPGWAEGIQLMNVGSSHKLYIPSALAYGVEGAGGVIGPNETLVFEVELLATEKDTEH
jgi:FKBP-type peptidyl-prolyl cis-trans isomerase FkpA